MQREKFSAWKKKYKIGVQVIAFGFALIFPFILYIALNHQLSLLAGFMFGGVTLAMVMVAALT